MVGIDALSSHKSIEVETIIRSHLKALRTHSRYKKSHIIFIPESNMSFIMTDHWSTIASEPQYAPVLIDSRDTKAYQRPGITTTHELKELYSETFAHLLKTDTIHFSTEMVGENIERDCKTLLQQCRVYRREFKEAPTVHTERKEVITGKGAKGQKDDLCICAQISITVSQMIVRDPKYKNYALEKRLVLF